MPSAPRSIEGWNLVKAVLEDLGKAVEAEAETELELVEGLRVLARVTALEPSALDEALRNAAQGKERGVHGRTDTRAFAPHASGGALQIDHFARDRPPVAPGGRAR